MHTYEVWIRDNAYQGKTPLTYTSTERLLPGVIVRVPLKQKTVLGIVKRLAPAPKGIAMKPIDEVLTSNEMVLPMETLKLITWLNLYYPSGSGSITQLFVPQSWPKKPRQKNIQQIIRTPQPTLPPLTKQQNSAVQQLSTHIGTAILHGDTGTGKTRIYIELIRRVLHSGKSALVLVPEIGLTPQLLTELVNAFPSYPHEVLHSGINIAERRNSWLRILKQEGPQIILGPRSALFAPIKNLGCIIVDECHDESYKQDNSPGYHALRVASQLGILHEATTVFGSATPNISDMYIAKQKNVPIVRLTERAKKIDTATTNHQIINHHDKREFTKSPYLSSALLKAINNQLTQGLQSFLFLNRRGSARIVVCSECNWRALCPRCNLPLTLHEDVFKLRCHTCGFHQKAPVSCPECGNVDITYFGPGTKALETELTQLFPNTIIARFDSDNLTHERLDKQIARIKDGEIDIIIGTQILVKGFDIPKLGLVGIIDADTSLSFPDFSVEEKTYQLINQAIGRVGRGHVAGNVVVQTNNPESRLLLQALSKNWDDFYNDQIKFRREYIFPPFTFLLKLECRRKKQTSAIQAANKLRNNLLQTQADITVLGPSPSFHEYYNGYYSWQLVIKSVRRSDLLKIIAKLPSGWKYTIDPTHLL